MILTSMFLQLRRSKLWRLIGSGASHLDLLHRGTPTQFWLQSEDRPLCDGMGWAS